MLSDQFFRIAGFYVQPGFFSEQECARLRSETREGAVELAGIVQGPETVVDVDYRRTRRAEIKEATESFLVERMQQVKPRLEAHFGMTFREMQPVQLLAYGVGDFFALHTDSKDRPDVPDFLRDRRVSTVVYLGHEDAQDEAQEGERGGVLQFRELIPDPRVADRAYAFTPAVGTLLAFPSTALHEVTPVLRGERYSLVAWFC